MTEMTITILRLVMTTGLLLYASASDVLWREVSDWVWLVGVPTSLLLDFIEVYVSGLELIPLIASMASSLLIGYVLCSVGFYGGADGKALLLIAAGAPSYPEAYTPLIRILPLPILLVLFSSTILSAVYPVRVLILNLIDFLRGKKLLDGIEERSLLKRILLYATVRRVKFEKLKEGLKYFPAERVVFEKGKAKRKPIYFLRAEEDVEKIVEELEEYRGLFCEGVLASPTTPMILFQTAGFIISNLIIYQPLS